MQAILTLLHSEPPILYSVLVILSAIGLRCISTPLRFSAIFTEEINFRDFLFASLEDDTHTIGVYP